MALQKASRKKAKIRMSISSPTGFGKTISALLIAFGITNDWDKIALIDTENRSGSLYANFKLPGGQIIGEFLTDEIAPPFTTEKYIASIKECEASGIEVIIIDSVSHVWTGQGGLIESNNALGSNTFQNWAKTTPRYQLWLNSILHSKCHVICTSRKKQEYVLVDGPNGKKTPEKKGMADIIRDGFDYEMTIAFDIENANHLITVGKDRTGLFSGKPEFIVTVDTGKQIKEWCESGAEQDAIPELPPLPTAHFEAFAKRVAAGEAGLLEKITATYSLTNEQKTALGILPY